MSRPTRLTLTALAGALLLGATAAQAQPALRVRSYATGLSQPVAIVQDPTDRAVQFVVEQGGRIRVVRNGTVLPANFLDLRTAILSGGERGLLGMAFDPGYATNGRFFVNFTDLSGNTVVARFKRSTNPMVADPASRFDLRWISLGGQPSIPQPYANHNGGNLAFGPDGYLYVGMGDGGSGDDPENRAQNPGTLLGKMLRIDIRVGDANPNGYTIPPDNPFAGGGFALPEIWSVGLRNPWKYSFDDPARGGTGALVIGDVGQGAWEEVDYEPAHTGGRNYGWRVREGAHDRIIVPGPSYTPLTEPIHEYSHGVGQSISGGFVYRGSALGPFFRGRYFFADFVAGRIWSLGLSINATTGEATAGTLIEHTGAFGGSGRLGNVSAFGLDADGELLIVSYSGGEILQVLGPPSSSHPANADWDGDGRSDVGVYRPGTGYWDLLLSTLDYSVPAHVLFQWGGPGDIPILGDFDGDGRTDVTVYRPAGGIWFIRYSSTAASGRYEVVPWGIPDDVPIAGDFDGDGRTDITVYRPSTGQWIILTSSSNFSVASYQVFQWGSAGDVPLAGDFDGDGRTDLVVYRPAAGVWFVRTSSSGFTPSGDKAFLWGLSDDTPLAGDFDGDGRMDISIFRPSNGYWFIRYSGQDYSVAAYGVFQWALPGDLPVTLDLDGDGKTELAVYRPASGNWFVRYSSQGYNTSTYGLFQWGFSGDQPISR